MTDKISTKGLSAGAIQQLILGIFFDAVGMLSFSIPFLGEFSDVIWAPLSALILAKMYKGTVGRVGGCVSLVEELLPFTDIIPTFTLTWIYTHIIRKDKV